MPTPTPTPTPSQPATYLTFSEILIYRLGAGITLQSACSGVALQGQPPTVLPASLFGKGLAFRYVATPQVWAVDGEVSFGTDGRDGDPSVVGAEVARAKLLGPNLVRFAVLPPVAGGKSIDYVRLAKVSAPLQGVRREYQCIIGSPTLAADLAQSASGTFRNTTLMATAYLADGVTAYSLDRSVVSTSVDLPAKKVTVSVRLIGSRAGEVGDRELGTYTATAPIDPASDNFAANLASSDRAVTGTLSGHFFGPGAVEIGIVLGGSVPATASTPAFTFSGAAFGSR